MDPGNMQGSETQQKLDDMNDKKKGGRDKAVIEVSHMSKIAAPGQCSAKIPW